MGLDMKHRIYMHGGTCAQIAKPDMWVVYGGTVTRESLVMIYFLINSWMGVQAYNLKLIMDKDMNDVIKPAWIKRSITLGKAAPFHHKLVCLCEVWKDG